MAIEPITDTHCHIIDRGRLRYPWLAGAGGLDRDWPMADYACEARRVGITRTLHMEVDVAEADITAETAYVEALAATPGSLLAGIIAACRPESAGFEAEVEAARARPLVKGFRRVLHVVPDALSGTSTFRANLRWLATADMPFDLCVTARQLPLAIALADAAPQTRFVLDHCGVPDIAGGGWDSWARDISTISERGNLCVKLSGIVAYAAPDWSAADLARWVDHVATEFGADRLVWGGDWPVCTLGGGLSTWVAATRAILSGASAAEREAIYTTNATRIWSL